MIKSFIRTVVTVGVFAAAVLASGIAQEAQGAGTRWVTGYYASYSEFPPSSMPPSEIDYSALTHVIHWPVVPLSNGALVDPDTFGLTTAQSAEVVSRAHAAGTKALLGFGGDAASVGDGWHGATLPANRARLIANMVSLMQARGYDGLDINWEELAPADEPQFVAFIRELRTALDAIVPRPLLTWVPTTGYLPPISVTAATRDYFDQINLQTYVMSGPYDGWVTWFNSPIYNGGATFPSTGGPLPSADAEVDRYVAAGIPVDRLGLGIQFDGFVWAGGSGTPTGGVAAPRQDFDDANSPTMTVLRYAGILAQFTPATGCQKHFDAVARVPWIGCNRPLNADDRFVSFDDEQAIEEKAQYIAQKGMGGVFVFELSGDFRPAETGDARHPLLTALKAAFRPPAPVASDDSYGTTAGIPLTITAPGVLANDNPNGGGALSAQVITTGPGGTFALAADGGFTYTPAAGFTGTATFSYTATNANGTTNLANVTITVSSPPLAPVAIDDTYSTTAGIPLTVAAPGVLVNDNPNSGGALSAQVVSTGPGGTFTLAANGGFTYVPAAGFTGTATFSYRATNANGTSNTAIVTIAVGSAPILSLEPPTGLTPESIVGNTVSLTWTAPGNGIARTGYVLEGGLSPGEVVASIPISSAATSYTFAAPTGVFYVRMHSVVGAERSAASNEVRIFVNVPAPPSVPLNLLGMVNGSELVLSWSNTALGGAPTEVLLTVAGTINSSLLLPLTETFSYTDVPPGTYTFAVSAVNASGTSAPSNPVTLTFPAPCSGAPGAPTSLHVSKENGTISIHWGAPTSGAAVMLYTLNVTGAFTGTIPTTGRSLSGSVGPGSYTMSVAASNACGVSAATPPLTISVP